VDDGPATQAEALALLRTAAANGIATVVATPHCSPRYPTAPEVMAEGVAEMRAALAAAGIGIALEQGAEVALEMALQLPDAELRRLTLAGSRCLLLECPLAPAVGDAFERCVDDLQRRGYRILLAHPERSPAFLGRPARLRALVDRGALCSVTASAVAGAFGSGPHWYSLELLRDGLVHSLDSDAHDAERRPPDIGPGLQAAATALPAIAAQAGWLTTDAPAALLADDPLPASP
jgi:protein-tyrosine phosphatase